MPAEPLRSRPVAEATTLDFVWLELLSRCNLACVHCYASSGPRVDAGTLPTARWIALLEEAFTLGCREVQLTGGEPTLHPDAPLLCDEAARIGFRTVELFTNATNLDDEWVAQLARHGHHAAVSLYSHRADVHDRVTRTPGSHTRTMRGIRRLVAAGVRVRVEVVVLEENVAEMEQTRAFIRDDLGVAVSPKSDPVRPNGRGRDLVEPRRRRQLPLASARPFARTVLDGPRGCAAPERATPRTCWSGKLAITAGGDVLPCIFSRDLVVGNVCSAPLAEVVTGPPLRELWSLGLDDVPDCRECDHKHECFDCRSLPHSVTGDLRAKNPRCRYEPPARHLRRLSSGRFVRRPGLAVREVDAELVAIDEDESLIHLANESATVLLAALERPRTVAELGRALEDVFEIDPATALQDARSALAIFLARGLVDEASES